MDILFSQSSFAIMAIIAIAPWLVATYWHLLLQKRLHAVSREIFNIPENIPWNKRALKAKQSDTRAQYLARKRNIYTSLFMIVILFEAVLLGVAICMQSICK